MKSRPQVRSATLRCSLPGRRSRDEPPSRNCYAVVLNCARSGQSTSTGGVTLPGLNSCVKHCALGDRGDTSTSTRIGRQTGNDPKQRLRSECPLPAGLFVKLGLDSATRKLRPNLGASSGNRGSSRPQPSGPERGLWTPRKERRSPGFPTGRSAFPWPGRRATQAAGCIR